MHISAAIICARPADNDRVRHYRWRSKRLLEVLTAVNCACLLDMDIRISVYQEAICWWSDKKQQRQVFRHDP